MSAALLAFTLLLAYGFGADGALAESGGHQLKATVATTGSSYTPITPTRVLDTRSDHGAAVPPGDTVVLRLAGRYGLPEHGLTAVTLNVTVTQPTAPGYLTVYPTGVPMPVVSSLNWTAGQTVPNQVTVQVVDGSVSLHNGSQGTAHLVVDLLGSYAETGNGYHADAPKRLLDTRTGLFAEQRPVPPGGSIDLRLLGVPSSPPEVMTAVTLNVTVTRPTAPGYLTVYPTGVPRPLASNLNWTPGQTVANLVTVPVKDDRITFYNGSSGTVQVVADLAGHFAETGLRYYPVTPQRLIDTRGRFGHGPLVPGARFFYSGQWFDGLPAARVLNVTVTQPTAPGYLTAFGQGDVPPPVSSLNWSAGQTVANGAVTTIDGYNEIGFYNGSQGSTHLVVDLFGSYAY
ncbi:hypothetical protein [Kitasatospora sp. MMS16-BH015]|uniref:hypothetical protein n=1 Tax=Kitasatospora sp. MMS16-BH015 TaxID=2018025 RepID=UPI000CF211EA|nr:hypothetical protein [Kitasatospora sp. MMS16-BH015]